MQRAFSIAFSLAAVVLSAVLAFHDAPSLSASTGAGSTPLDGGRALVDAGTTADASPASGDTTSTTSIALADPGMPSPAPAPVEVPDGGFRLADGTPVSPLGRGAPLRVRFGVILVTYEGAEGAPEKGARRKSEALALAAKLGDEAKEPGASFHAIVQRGDVGSDDDLGVVTRGVLEPTPEAVLFALPIGGVSGVVDTPRGFWIVKRLQ